MKISDKLVTKFYYAMLNQSNFKYRDYSFRFVNRDIQVKLLKGNRLLSTWSIESNMFETYDDLEANEKRFIKKFEQLPIEAEKLFQIKRQKEKENSIPRRKEVLMELDNHFSLLSDNDVTQENINIVIEKVANNWLYEWFEKGSNPDKFADSLYNHESQTRTWLNTLVNDVNDHRVIELLNKENKSSKSIEKIKVYPRYAQREGNLVRITEVDHQRFIKMFNKAVIFATDYIKENPNKFLEKKQIQVNWWEDIGEFYVNEGIDKENPRTLRDFILIKLDSVINKRAKPSRLILDVFVSEEDFKETMTSPQLGKLEWKKEEIKLSNSEA